MWHWLKLISHPLPMWKKQIPHDFHFLRFISCLSVRRGCYFLQSIWNFAIDWLVLELQYKRVIHTTHIHTVVRMRINPTKSTNAYIVLPFAALVFQHGCQVCHVTDQLKNMLLLSLAKKSFPNSFPRVKALKGQQVRSASVDPVVLQYQSQEDLAAA